MWKNRLVFVFLISALCVLNLSCAKQNFSISETAQAEETITTPADQQIRQARQLIEKNASAAKNHNLLAAALLQKVRETGDYRINSEAERSLQKAEEIEPGNFESKVLRAQIYLSEHEFDRALEIADALTPNYPGNQLVLTIKTDAQIELGRYEEAVETAQKLVDTRPNAGSYTRVAYLRSLYGDPAGAIEARLTALKMADPLNKENQAWFHSELGREYFNAGKYEEAERMYDRALEIFPAFHWALAGKAGTRAALGDLTSAAAYLEKIRLPQVANRILLADIYKKSGREAEAQRIYTEVADGEKASENGDMHRIALLWADHDKNLDEALDIARRDREENADLLSSDTLAWALYKKGEYREAKKYITEAMRLKTKNSLFFYHAGMIENALGNRPAAIKYLKLALETNPAFDLLQADIARETLRKLQ